MEQPGILMPVLLLLLLIEELNIQYQNMINGTIGIEFIFILVMVIVIVPLVNYNFMDGIDKW